LYYVCPRTEFLAFLYNSAMCYLSPPLFPEKYSFIFNPFLFRQLSAGLSLSNKQTLKNTKKKKNLKLKISQHSVTPHHLKCKNIPKKQIS